MLPYHPVTGKARAPQLPHLHPGQPNPSLTAKLGNTRGLAGLGVGCTFAVMPRLIMRAVSPEQTSGALGVNQVMCFIGFSVGSALSAAILAAFGGSASALPRRFGYDVATLFGAGVWVVTAVMSYLLTGRTRNTMPSPALLTPDERLAITECVDAAASRTMRYEIPETGRQRPESAPSPGVRHRPPPSQP
jgi:hypothetical protein